MGLSELACKTDDFVCVAPVSGLAGGEGLDGRPSGSLGHGELDIKGLILGEPEVVEGSKGRSRGGTLEGLSSSLIQLKGSSGRGYSNNWRGKFHSWNI